MAVEAQQSAPAPATAATTTEGAPARGVAGDPMSSRVDVINTKAGRILCVADVRGALSSLNSLAAEHSAVAIIHSGDFGFYEPSSLASISDRTLKHLVQYSPLIPPAFRSQLLSPNTSPAQMRDLLANPPRAAEADGLVNGEHTPASSTTFGLSEFPRLLSGELKFNVPVYTVWGACEDVAVLEKIRLAPPSPQSVPSDPSKSVPIPPSTATRPSSIPSTPHSYSIPNLTVLDEATTRVLLIGGVRLRLFGLGGAVVQHKLFDNGQGTATIAGGQGTMWTTMLQIGELVDTAQKVYDPSETRLLISHASPGREGLLSQLALVLKADLTLSAGLHFRYGVSYNEFSVQHDPEAFRTKLDAARKAFAEIWDAVKNQVEGVVDESQRALLQNALAVANRVPASNFVGGAANVEEAAWKNCWNWNLPDAQYGNLILDIRDGRIGSEMKSQGFNFAYRQNAPRPPPAAAATSASAAASQPSVPPSNPSFAASTPAPPAAVSARAAPSQTAPASTNPGASANATATPAPNSAPSLPFAQRPFGGPNGPAGPGGAGHHPHPRQTPLGPRGRGRGGFGAPGSALRHQDMHNQQQQQQQQQQSNAASPAQNASPANKQETASNGKEEKSQGGVNGAGPDATGSQTPAPQQQQQQQQRTHSGRGQRGQTPHQRQLQQQAREQQASASSGGETPAAASESAAPSSKKQGDAAAGNDAGNTSATAAGDSSAAEGPLSPSTPGGGDSTRGGGRGGRGGPGGRGRGSRGRSNGEWTRGASGRGGRGGDKSAGEGAAATPAPDGGKKSSGGGGGGGENAA
ncbi:hypothetical protein JCM10908_003718 [Rhodotorula pacifica]|uniref:DUF2433 domain-containing protein n=1 Tax=Rhodotorula pacifica TaxID=1495444 RepID=UPI00317100ED